MTALNQKDKWNQRYANAQTRPRPSRVLADHQHLLPTRGKALDLACGLGGNALALAENGLDTHAWDIASKALDHLNGFALIQGLQIRTLPRDCEAEPPGPESFDVIVISHFLHRPSAPSLSTALRPGGLLFYQTFTQSKVSDNGPSNPDFRLKDNELLNLFPGLLVRAYREEGTVGDTQKGFRDQALLVAQRPCL